jgi:hypothetical protein
VNESFDITSQRRYPGKPGSPRRRRRERAQARPDRFALWAVLLGVVAMLAGVASADGATSGAVGTAENKVQRVAARYHSIYDGFKRRDKRWARIVSKCESGHNPKAISPDEKHRGAFQFKLSTWRTAPKSPGGDPVDYTWKTQAVVAVALRNKARRQGWKSPWPTCSKVARRKLSRKR